MGNRFLGEHEVEHEGQKYKLRLDFNAMCEFEADTGQSANEAFERFEKGTVNVTTMRAMVLCMLKRHHPEATHALAGDILSSNVDLLLQVISSAMPTDKEAQELKSLGKQVETALEAES